MQNLYISMYHYTRDIVHSRYPEIKGLDQPLFRQQLEFMKENFNIVTMEQVMDAVEKKCKLPEKALLLTFDDGYVDNYTYAMPLLEEFGVQGSFFIPGKTFATHQLLDVNKIHYMLACADIYKLVDDVKEKMEFYRGREFDFPETEELWNQYAVANRWDCKETIFVKRMLQTVLPERLRNQISSDLFEKYVGMTEEQMQQDIKMALDTLDEFIDRKRWVMNYPYGNYSDDVLKYVKTEGACVGLTTEVRLAKIGQDNPLTLPRLDCNDFPPKSKNYKRIEEIR